MHREIYRWLFQKQKFFLEFHENPLDKGIFQSIRVLLTDSSVLYQNQKNILWGVMLVFSHVTHGQFLERYGFRVRLVRALRVSLSVYYEYEERAKHKPHPVLQKSHRQYQLSSILELLISQKKSHASCFSVWREVLSVTTVRLWRIRCKEPWKRENTTWKLDNWYTFHYLWFFDIHNIQNCWC